MRKALLFGIALFVSRIGTSAASELLLNGDFESGTTDGWSRADRGGGSFVIAPVGGTPPISGGPGGDGPFQSAPNASGGSFFVVSDTHTGGQGSHVLYQSFLVPEAGGSVSLRFQMFENNYSGTTAVAKTPEGADTLDHTVSPNQHTRVDIMTPSLMAINPFDTAAGVIRNLHIGGPPTSTINPNPYTGYQFDISDAVATPGTYVLRFAEVDNQFVFNMGIDNISIQFSPVPEPGVTSLALLGGLLAIARRGFLMRSRGKNQLATERRCGPAEPALFSFGD